MIRQTHLPGELHEALLELPMVDAYARVTGGQLGARGLHDLLLDPMLVSELYAAGCPSGHRLTGYPLEPSEEETKGRILEALPFLPHIQATGAFWAFRHILESLYGWREPVTALNWKRLDAVIREQATGAGWPVSVLKTAHIRAIVTSTGRRGRVAGDGFLHYVFEEAFFTRRYWGEYDTALYELERCWVLGAPTPRIAGGERRSAPERTLASLDDVHEAVKHYIFGIPKTRASAALTHISTDIDLTPVSPAAMRDALANREQAGDPECGVYAAYVNEAFLVELERVAPQLPVQFILGAEPLPHATGARLSQRTIAQVADMVSRHPRLRFQCILEARHANQAICSLCRSLPNLSLAGFHWNSFYPGLIRQCYEERLDMLPLNRQIGFLSDAACVEWIYGRAFITRRCLAEALAPRIRSGQFNFDGAVATARAVLHDTAMNLLALEPYPALAGG